MLSQAVSAETRICPQEAQEHLVMPRSGLLPTGGAVGDGLAGGEDAEGMPALAA
jgi:hypothetical protein